MVYCSNCGAQLSEEACFCPNCGTKTAKGVKENVKYPTDELKEVFTQAGVELEKAFTIAAHEMRKAFKNVKEEFSANSQNQKIVDMVTCKSCEATNEQDAVFCRTCGAKIEKIDKAET